MRKGPSLTALSFIVAVSPAIRTLPGKWDLFGSATIQPQRQYSFCSAIFGPTNYHFRMGWNQEQLLGFALTDWLLESGERVARKCSTLGSLDELTLAERLLYEFWIFDMEQQNGGVSQYFLNWPVSHWNSHYTLEQSGLPSFNAFAMKIESIVSGVPDAHEAFQHIDVDVDGLYGSIRVPVLQELQAFIQNHS